MKKTLTLAEAKEFYKEEKVFETETGFLVNMFGKYRPNITFVVPKVYDLGEDGKPMSPIYYSSDREVTDNMNLDFDGSAEFLFGDFWRSKKGGACFRPKDPLYAKHLLIVVDWGGCFNSSRGNYAEDVKDIDGLLYFRRASSNGGGSGCDYWVLPVGYTRSIHDEEVDGSAQKNNRSAIYEERAKAYRKKHSDLRKKAVEKADAVLRERMALEEASRAAREQFIPRLMGLQAEIAELSRRCSMENISEFGDAYFFRRYTKYLYNEENLVKLEEEITRNREWLKEREAKEAAQAEAKALYGAKYEELRGRMEKLGWELVLKDDRAAVKNPANIRRDYYIDDEWWGFYDYNLDDVEKLRKEVEEAENRLAVEELRARNKARIQALLATTELPENLWHLFDGSEDMDSVILGEVEAILAAAKVEKDDMEMHELCVCGYGRRCDAIYRVLKRVGGGVATININSQSASKELAWFIAGC